MNILLINNVFRLGEDWTLGAVEYHRMMKPHSVLRTIVDDMGLKMAIGVPKEGYETLQEKEVFEQTDIVVISRYITNPDWFFDKMERMNIAVCLDLDDFWNLPEYHIAYDVWVKGEKAELIKTCLKRATFVTASTPILAENIKEFNKNVYVCPNGIDSGDEAWKPNKEPSERLRFGFTQGDTHFEDISSIAGDVVKALKDPLFYSKGQIVQAGFAGKHHRKTNEVKIQYLLTDNLKTLRRDYPDHVHDLRIFRESNNKDVPYRIKWGVDVYSFPSIYNEIDVSVVPLLEGEFNSCKSELKMLEAAYKDCAVMVSHVKPYTLLATDKNSFDLNKKPFNEWAKYLIENPNALEDSKAQLKEDCKKYDLKTLAEQRKNIYLKYKK